MHRRLVLTALVGLLVACGTNGGPGDGGADVATLSVAPRSGPPGTPLAVGGLEGLDLPADLRVHLGDRPVPFVLHDDGTLTTAIPLFGGDGGWPVPPAEPQVLELRGADGRVLGRAADPVRVTELARAPGAARRIQDALTEVATGTEALLALLPETQPQQAALREAAVATLRGIVDDGGNTLQGVLDGTAPLLDGASADPALAEALLASSGAVAYYEAYAESLSGATAALRTQALGGLCEEEGPDADLACLMQIHTVLADYAEIVVKPTAYAYAHTVGLGAGYASALAVAHPGVTVAGIVGALLGIADFVMNDVVPGLLPSEISRFDLVLLDTALDPGEVTESILTIAATNDPPNVSAADLAELVLGAIGLKGLDDLAPLRALTLEVAKFYIDLFYKVLRAAEAASPGTFPDLDADHLSVPSMTWGPVEVRNERLVTLSSLEPEVIVPLPEGEGLEWRAVDLGDATVRALTRGAGETARLLRDHVLCLGCVYRGGAFGLDSAGAEADVRVGSVFLTAVPANGKAPLITRFRWEGLDVEDEPLTCTLDPGDGSEPIVVEDCAVTTSTTHTYATTSRLASAGGAHVAELTVMGTEKAARTEVTVGWTLEAAPRSGDGPLDVVFSWSGFDPDGPTLSCTLDPGDGSAVRTIADCANATTASHRYTTEGVYSATLTVDGGAFSDFAGVTITVGDPAVECAYLAEVEDGWVATYDMGYADSDGYTDALDHAHFGSLDVHADVAYHYDRRYAGDGSSWASAPDSPRSGAVRVDATSTRTVGDSVDRTTVHDVEWVHGGFTYLEFDPEACTYTIDVRVSASAEQTQELSSGYTRTDGISVSPGWLVLGPMPLPPSLDGFPLHGSRTVPARSQGYGGACVDCFLFVAGTSAAAIIYRARDFPEWFGNASVSWSIAPLDP